MLILSVACASKQTEAQFNRSQEEVLEDLKNLYDFDDVKILWTEEQLNEDGSRQIDENIKWTANRTANGVGRNLKVYLTNGIDLPETVEERTEIGKEAMQLVLNSIENEEDYDNFLVVFVHEAVYGGMDMRSENPYGYKLEELEQKVD